MRIALLSLHYAEYASRLALALADRHEVLLIMRSDNARDELTPQLRSQVQAAVQVREVHIHKMRDPRVLLTGPSINRIIRAFAPDVIHVQEVHPWHSGGTILGFRGRVPLILTVHDPIPHSGSKETTTRGRIIYGPLPWLRRRCDRLIVHGPRMRATLEARDASCAGKVDVVPHGVLGERSAEQGFAAREPGTFLFFGRVQSYKGLVYALDACDTLRARGHQIRLIVAGTGNDLERHRARITAQPWVELIDRYIPAIEVEQLFHRPLATVLPYTDATQSGVAAVALSNCCPVIASAVGDLPEAVLDGQTGLLVPPRDAASLAAAMERVLLDPALAAAMAAAAGRHAAEKLGWPRIAELTEASFSRALAGRTGHCRVAASPVPTGRD